MAVHCQECLVTLLGGRDSLHIRIAHTPAQRPLSAAGPATRCTVQTRPMRFAPAGAHAGTTVLHRLACAAAAPAAPPVSMTLSLAAADSCGMRDGAACAGEAVLRIDANTLCTGAVIRLIGGMACLAHGDGQEVGVYAFVKVQDVPHLLVRLFLTKEGLCKKSPREPLCARAKFQHSLMNKCCTA